MFFIGVLLIMGGCTQQGAEVSKTELSENAEVQVLKTTVASDTGREKYTATLAIDGMGCAMACGSKISGALAGLEGVVKTDVDFKGAGERNNVIVEFDASKISESKMIETVNGLKGGHYEVKSVAVTHHKVTGDKPEADQVEEKDKMSAVTSKLQYELPNIFSVFSRLF